MKYIEDNPKTAVEFSPFEAPWQRTIPLAAALQIASDYWGIEDGDVDEETGYAFAILPVYSDTQNYRISLAWWVENDHLSTIEIIEIHGLTGEITVPSDGPADVG